MAEVGSSGPQSAGASIRGGAGMPGFRVIAFDKPFSVEDIRAMSTAQHMYVQEGDSIEDSAAVADEQGPPAEIACIAISALSRSDQPDGFMLE